MSGSCKKSLSDRKFEKLAEIAKTKFGLHITESKRQLVSARIQKRMEQLGIETFDNYFNLLSSSPTGEEDEGLIGALTTNVTQFFREPHHFELIGCEFRDRLIEKAMSGEKVRVWCAGCSTGQETYSLVIKILEVFPDAPNYDLRILSTDIDPLVLSRAKAGIYTIQEVSGLDANLINQHFKTVEGGYQIDGRLTRMVTFGSLNLMEEFPMKGFFDIILCRNVAIYFDRTIQEVVWTKIYRRLANQGLLMIGHSERLYGEALENVESAGTTAYRQKAPINSVVL